MLDHFLVTCRDRRLVTARGQQRTDATHVLAAIRTLNRLECLGETLAHTLHQLLWDAPGWARTTIPAAWWDRYGPRFGQFRLPKTVAERAALAVAMGVVDSAYPDADGLVRSQAQGIDLVAPVQHDRSWQAQASAGFAVACFAIDWEAAQAQCPQGQTSRIWSHGQDAGGHAVIHIQFDRDRCGACAARPACTRAVTGPRTLTGSRGGRCGFIVLMLSEAPLPLWERDLG